MKVWVVMGNDFPDAVFVSREAAEEYCAKERVDEADQRIRNGDKFGPRIHWRTYEFELQA